MQLRDRALTAITFPLVGPLVGGLWLLAISAASELASGTPAEELSARSSVPIIIGISYVAGFLPAIVTGFVYSALPSAWQRVVVSLLIGGIVTWSLWELLSSFIPPPGPSPPSTYFAMVGAGVAAAGVSAFAARRVLKLLGREYDHSGGIGGPS